MENNGDFLFMKVLGTMVNYANKQAEADICRKQLCSVPENKTSYFQNLSQEKANIKQLTVYDKQF